MNEKDLIRNKETIKGQIINKINKPIEWYNDAQLLNPYEFINKYESSKNTTERSNTLVILYGKLLEIES